MHTAWYACWSGGDRWLSRRASRFSFQSEGDAAGKALATMSPEQY